MGGIFKRSVYRSAGALSYVFLATSQCLPYSIKINKISYEVTPIYFIVIAIILAALDWYFIQRKIDSVRKTRVKNFSNLLAIELKIVSDNLKLTDKERISLYKYDAEGFFILQARHSESSEYRKSGRPIYNVNEGAINLAFDSGSVYRDQLPSPLGGGLRSYLEYSETHFNMKRATTKKIRMKSRAYAAKVLKDSLGEKIAVLLLETVNKDFTHLVQDHNNKKVLDETRVKSFLVRECNRLSYFFELHNPNNSIRYAHSEGL